ncbi:MAG: DUF1501 domain-containing protein [Rhodoferax sp.]|nr:DUF1501 domain-containing protein [Rhodoferax sp.]
MMDRRQFLAHAGAVSMAGVGASLLGAKSVQAADFKALVVVFLSGGFDGNNMLVPVDAAYGDYAAARPSLALPKDSLVRLQGTHIGHQFGLSPAMGPLASLFAQQRMAVVANVGALVQPTTVAQVRDRTAKLPPFLGSHAEQEQWTQGWMGDENRSGWGGRVLDQLPADMRNRQPLIALARDYTALLANVAPLSLANSNASANWGRASLTSTTDPLANRVEWASRMQSGNAYEAEFARSLRSSYLDSLEFAKGQQYGAAPSGNFPDKQIGRDLRFAARHMAYSKQAGARRQIYLVQDGGYDTHTGQLLTDGSNPGLEARLSDVVGSLTAFDDSIRSAGMGSEVLTVVMSEFGRTLDPAAGAGSDHAWGNHWFVLGDMVKGGVVYGSAFPTLKTGGVDDASLYEPKRGQWVPQFSSDQFVADAARWLGLSAEQTLAAMPNLANFAARTIGYI